MENLPLIDPYLMEKADYMENPEVYIGNWGISENTADISLRFSG
jgi:hypothetical protein